MDVCLCENLCIKHQDMKYWFLVCGSSVDPKDFFLSLLIPQVVILYFEPNTFRCILLRWVRLLGFATVYGTVTLKLHRYIIFFQFSFSWEDQGGLAYHYKLGPPIKSFNFKNLDSTMIYIFIFKAISLGFNRKMFNTTEFE